MNALILRGNTKQKEDYIHKYIRDNEIPEYNITRFDESLKIADARQIKSSLGKTSVSGKKRLFIIQKYPNAEAQNALLKTLEELDEATDFIFSCEEELLPTIVSRCTITNVSEQNEVDKITPPTSKMIDELTGNDRSQKLLAIQAFFSEEHDHPYEDLMLQLRYDLKVKTGENNSEKTLVIFNLLRKLSDAYPLVIFNNLNAKLTVEKVILGS